MTQSSAPIDPVPLSPTDAPRTGVLHRLYQRLLALSKGRYAEPWLAVIAFTESSFFPLAPDLLLIPMAAARPDRAWRYAAITTIASVLGGMLGYLIGFALQPVGLAILKLFGHSEGLAVYHDWFAKNGVWVILAKGLTPIPFKLVTIASGLAQFNFALFVLACTVTRGARFFLWAAILRRYGEPVLAIVEKRLAVVTVAALGLVVVGLLAAHFLKV